MYMAMMYLIQLIPKRRPFSTVGTTGIGKVLNEEHHAEYRNVRVLAPGTVNFALDPFLFLAVVAPCCPGRIRHRGRIFLARNCAVDERY